MKMSVGMNYDDDNKYFSTPFSILTLLVESNCILKYQLKELK
jgi:hypothetical protein